MEKVMYATFYPSISRTKSNQALDFLPTPHSSFLLESRCLFLLSKSEEERGGGEAGKLQTSYDVFCNLISQA